MPTGLLGAAVLPVQMLVPRSWQLNGPALPVEWLRVKWLAVVPAWKLIPIWWLLVIVFDAAFTAPGAEEFTSMPLLPAPAMELALIRMSCAVSRTAMPL